MKKKSYILVVLVMIIFVFSITVSAAIPLTPTILAPGTNSVSGSQIDNLTPTFSWTSVSNATSYVFAISESPYGKQYVVYNSGKISGTSFTIPTGKLTYGKSYRWNLQAINSSGLSSVTNTLYFKTPVKPNPIVITPVTPTATETAMLLVDNLKVSQGMNNNYSHKGDYAIDICGKDQNIESLKAPFTGTIKKISTGCNAVWLESNQKVKYANGTLDYMTIMTIHDNDVSNLSVGQVIKQGTVYYEEGTKGEATGNHIHIACGKGKFTNSGWYQNSYGTWCINKQYPINKALSILSNCNIINNGGYKWNKL